MTACPEAPSPDALEPGALSGPAAPPRERATRHGLLRVARRRYLAGAPLDMREMAAELGVSRATVYRWAGNRELLLGEVLWSYLGSALERARREAPGSGAPYVLEVFRRVLAGAAESVPLRRLLMTDPELSLRVLTSRHSVVQPRIVSGLRDVFRQEVAKGAFRPPVDLDTLSYAAVRIGESFLYSDLISGTERDIRRAVDILRLLLREAPGPERSAAR